jgi:hypothetical protein
VLQYNPYILFGKNEDETNEILKNKQKKKKKKKKKEKKLFSSNMYPY